MTALNVDLDAIEAVAETLRPGRVALMVAAAPFVLLGWLCAVVGVVLWRAGRFCVAAFLVGQQRARGPSRAQQISRLRAELADRDMQLSRVFGQQ